MRQQALKSGAFQRVVAAMALTACLSPLSQAAPTLDFSPSSATTLAPFNLELTGREFVDVYAYQFSLSWNPSVLALSGVTEGAALGSVGTTFFVPGAIDNTLGRLDLTANTLIGNISGFSGDGPMASFSFQPIAPGTTSVSLGSVMVLDSQLREVATGLGTAQITVPAVPEPGTWAMMLAGVLGVGFWSRRSRGAKPATTAGSFGMA